MRSGRLAARLYERSERYLPLRAYQSGAHTVSQNRSDVRASLAASVSPFASNAAKRTFDVVVALVALTVSAPILLVSAVAIRCESRGPVFFRQTRIGRSGKTFQIVKLRGMYVDARERFPSLYSYDLATTEDADGYFFHAEDDPRVTRVGRFLRRSSIDELPNFWNVLRGEMSVVGPRPEIPELVHLYGDKLEQLLSVRPGVTSPSKAFGRDQISFAETLRRDIQYIDERSFKLDLKTIVRTARSVCRGEGVA